MKEWNPNLYLKRFTGGMILFLVVILGIDYMIDAAWYPLGILLALAAGAAWVVLYIMFWRCPYCQKGLPRYVMEDLTHCPYCGERFPE